MNAIIFTLLSLLPALALAMPGSMSGNVDAEYGGGWSGASSGAVWLLLGACWLVSYLVLRCVRKDARGVGAWTIAFMMMPLAFVVYLISGVLLTLIGIGAALTLGQREDESDAP